MLLRLITVLLLGGIALVGQADDVEDIEVVGSGYSVMSLNFVGKSFQKYSLTYDGSDEGYDYAATLMKDNRVNLVGKESTEKVNGIALNKTYEGLVSEFPFPEETSNSGNALDAIGALAFGVIGYAIGGASGSANMLTNARTTSPSSAPSIERSQLKIVKCPEGKMVKVTARYAGTTSGIAVVIAATCNQNVTSLALEKKAIQEALRRMQI